MKKRIVAILLVCAMSTFLFACGNESTLPTEQTKTVESTEQQTTAEIPTTETADSTETEPAEEPTAEQETVENTETEESSAEQETAESTEIELTATTEPTEEATVQYTYTDLSAIMYAQQAVNVRNQPSTDGDKVGSLSTNQEVSVSGQCNETSWYRIEYSGSVAYVSNKYLGDSMVEVSQPATQAQSSSTGGYTNFYMENSRGTWYASDDGMTCDYFNNSMGRMVNNVSYTLAGIKAAYPNTGEFIYNEDGSLQVLACGCCASVYADYGITSFMEVCLTAEDMGYTFDHCEDPGIQWVADTPDTWPHNLSWYYFVK